MPSCLARTGISKHSWVKHLQAKMIISLSAVSVKLFNKLSQRVRSWARISSKTCFPRRGQHWHEQCARGYGDGGSWYAIRKFLDERARLKYFTQRSPEAKNEFEFKNAVYHLGVTSRKIRLSVRFQHHSPCIFSFQSLIS